MVIGAKDVRSIKVSNLPGNISNDVLRFLFKESTSVIRAPHSTTAVVEFNCVRDVAAYIHKDKTLMVEDKVLTIEGCSSKNEGTSNKDPLESRQLYIENIPHWTTTEYLDVLFPGAKSIRRVDGFTAVAEYRSAKDAQLELLKTKTLRIDQNQLVVVCSKDYRRNTSNNDGNPAQNVGRYSLSRKGKGYQSSYPRKPGSGNERSNSNNNSGGSYHSHKRHSASGSQNQDDNSLVTPPQDQLLSGNSTQANLLGLPQAFGKSSKSFQWKKPGSHHYSNVRSGRRHGPSRNTKENKDGATAEGEDCGDDNADSVGVHDPDGDGDVVEKSCVEAKSSGQQQMKRTATTVIGQNQKDSKTRQGSGSAVGPTQKEAKANPAASSSSSVLGRNQKEAKVTQKSTATEGVSVNQKEAKTNQKSAETGQNQTEAKANKKAPPTSKERSVTSRRESSTTHRSNSGTSKTVRSRSSSTKPIRDRSPHRDCPSKRMRTTDVPSTHTTGRGHSKTSRETTSPSSNDASKGHRHGDMQQGQSATTKKEDGSVTSSVSNLLNKLDMLAALSQFAKDYEDAYQTTQKGSQKKCHETENDKEKAMAPAGSTNNSKSKNRVLDRTMPHTSSTGSSRVRHRGDSSKNSDSINRGTSHDHGRSTRASDPSRARHRGDNSGGDGSCDSANRRGTSRLRGSSHSSTSWMSEPYLDSLRDHHRHHSQSTNMATTTDSRSARSRRSPCYDVNEGGGGVGRRSYLEMRNSEKYQLRGHSYHHGDNFDHDPDRHERDEWNGPRFWSENDSGRSRSSYANADVDLMRLSEVRGRSSEERGSSQSGSERRVWISGRLDHRNSGQGRSYQRDFRPDVNYENPDLRRWDEAEYDAGGGGGRRGRWEREEEEEVGRDGIGQRFSETSGPCGGRDRFGSSSYNDYDYDCYDDDDGGGDSGRRGVFDGRGGGKWTEDRRDMYERRKTFEEPFRAVHLNSGNDRLAFGDGERGEEEVEREGRFQQESNERRYNHPDLDNDYHLHGNRRATLSSSPSTHDNNNTSRSQSRDYYDGSSSSSHRAPLHDNRRVTTTAMSINPSKSEPRDYEGDGTRHRGKRQNMNPHPYGPDARTFRKGRDQGTAGSSSSCRGDKEWSVASRDVDERTVFLTNSVKHGGENCSRVNNADGGGGGAGGGRDAVRLGLGGKCQVGGSGADGSREAGGRFSSDVRCESGRFVGAEGRCKVGRFGSDGWSEGADERYSSSRMGPNDDEDCKGGRFGANESYEAGRFDIDERCMVSRFDVDERCAADRFDGDKRLTTADVNDAEKRGPRTSECDRDPSASRIIDQQGADGNNMGGRKFGVAAGSLGSCGGIDGSATNFRVGKSSDGGSRLDRSVNSDMQDCQLAFDVYERERFAPSEMEKTHNRNANGMRFNRHRGVNVGNSPKTVRALEERVNDKDDGGGGDRLMREDDKTDVHTASSGTGGGGGDDGSYGKHGENRDIDDRVFQQYSSNHSNNNNNNNLWPNGRRHRNGTVEAQHSGNYNQDRGLSSRAWNKQTENPNSLGLIHDTPFQGHEPRDKGSKRQFNVLSDAQGPSVAGRPLSFGVFDVNSSNNRNAETGGAEFSVELSNSLIMSANDTMKTENVGGHRGGQYRPENVRGGAGDGSERTFRRDNSANEETRINNNNNNNNNSSSNSPGFSSLKHHRRELGTALAGTPGFKGDRSQSHHHGQGHVQGQLLQPQGHHQGHTQAQQPVSQAQAQGEQGGGNSPRFRTTERRGSGDGGSGGGGSSEGGGGGGGGAGHFTDFRHSLPGMMPSSPYPSTGLSGLQQHHLHHHHHQQQQQQQQHPASIRMPTRASPPGLGTFQQAFPPPATAATLLPPPPIRGLPNGPFSSAVNPSPSLHHPPPPPSLPVGVVWPLVPLPPPTNLPLVDNAFYQAPAFNN